MINIIIHLKNFYCSNILRKKEHKNINIFDLCNLMKLKLIINNFQSSYPLGQTLNFILLFLYKL